MGTCILSLLLLLNLKKWKYLNVFLLENLKIKKKKEKINFYFLGLKIKIAILKNNAVKTSSIIKSNITSPNPKPLIIIALETFMEYVIGIATEIHWNISGKPSIGNIKPEKNMNGIKIIGMN